MYVFQGMYWKILLGVLLISLLAIFELELVYNEPNSLHGEFSEQHLILSAGKSINDSSNKQQPNLASESLNNKHLLNLQSKSIVNQSEENRELEEFKQSDRNQLPGVVNQYYNNQQQLSLPVMSNPVEQLVKSIDSYRKYNYCLGKLSSQLESVLNQLGVTNLTSQNSQKRFLSCGGKSLLRQLKGKQPNTSVHIPSSFQHCKNMSFKSSGPAVALASYPGSGNSWVRQLLESSTGIYTGGIYCDPAYIKIGMLGEFVNTNNVLAVKTHVPLFTNKRLLDELSYDKAIYIVRDPFNAFLADHKRKLAKKVLKLSNSHTAEVNYKYGMYLCIVYMVAFVFCVCVCACTFMPICENPT